MQRRVKLKGFNLYIRNASHGQVLSTTGTIYRGKGDTWGSLVESKKRYSEYGHDTSRFAYVSLKIPKDIQKILGDKMKDFIDISDNESWRSDYRNYFKVSIDEFEYEDYVDDGTYQDAFNELVKKITERGEKLGSQSDQTSFVVANEYGYLGGIIKDIKTKYNI